MRLRTVFGAIATVCVLLATSYAAVPLILNHQGRLLDAADRPVNGAVPIQFSLFDVSADGVALASETQVVNVDNGLFSVQLASLVGSDGLPDVPELWLGVKVGTDAELVPRLRIGSAPYALTSSRVQGDITTSPGSLTIGDETGNGLVYITSSIIGKTMAMDDWNANTGGAHLKALVSGASPGTTDLSALYLDVDDDGDGVPEAEAKLHTRRNGAIIACDFGMKSGGGSRLIDVTTDPVDVTLEMRAKPQNLGENENWLFGNATITGASHLVAADFDQDGLEDLVVSSKVTSVASTLSVQAGELELGSSSKLFSVTGQPSPVGEAYNGTYMRSRISIDEDGDGVHERSIEEKCDSLEARSVLAVDIDGNGHADGQANIAASLNGNTVIGSATDFDDDGTPDIGISSSTSIDRAILESFYERGDKPTESQFSILLDSDGHYSTDRSSNAVGGTTGLRTTRVTPDSVVELSSIDSGGSATSFERYLNKEKCLWTITCPSALSSGTVKTMATPDSVDQSSTITDGSSSSTYSMRNRINNLETSLQNIGILSRASIKQDCDDDDAGLEISAGVAIPKFINITAQAQNAAQNADVGMLMGSGPDTTIEIHSDDNSSSMKMRLPTGNSQEGVLTTEMTSTGASHSMTWDSDADGIIDVTKGEKCDDDGSSFEMTAGVAIPKFIEINARNASSLPGSTSNVSLVMGLGPDTAIDMRADEVLVSFEMGDASGDRFTMFANDGSSHMSVVPPTAGVYVFDLAVTDASSNLTMKNGSGLVALDLNGDGRIGINGAAHATNPVHHSSGAHLTVGGTWTNASDKNAKENFTEVDGEELLEKIEDLAITKWNYKSEDESITHIGPTAQDFKEAFGVGGDDKSISTVDPSGIALAAIKELIKQNQELAKQNAKLKKELEDLKKKVDDLASRR